MFSNPYAHRKTKLAELLPLSFVKCSKCTISLAPMMAKKRYRCLICKGFSFTIVSLIPGGGLDGQRKNLWNRYDIRSTAIRNQLRRFLEKDINQMAPLLAKVMAPRTAFIASPTCCHLYKRPSQITFRPTWTIAPEKEENLEDEGPSECSKFPRHEKVSVEFSGCAFHKGAFSSRCTIS